MERLKGRLEQASAALRTLKEALCVDSPSKLERDGTIQRFEYTFEIFWKACQAYMEEVEGVRCASPKTCLRELGPVGLAIEAQIVALLSATNDRNLTVHTYREGVAAGIYARLPDYVPVFEHVLRHMGIRTPSQ